MGNPKRSFRCRGCNTQIRTRVRQLYELELCNKCLVDNVKANIKVNTLEESSIDHLVMRERWYHELLYQQVEANGLSALGIGRLKWIHEKQRNYKRLGEWTHECEGYTNRYDLLLKDGKRFVCVEVKRVADENSWAQVQRYLTSLRKLSVDKGLEEPFVCVVTMQMTEAFTRIAELMKEHGIPIAVYRMSFEDGIKMERVQ